MLPPTSLPGRFVPFVTAILVLLTGFLTTHVWSIWQQQQAQHLVQAKFRQQNDALAASIEQAFAKVQHTLQLAQTAQSPFIQQGLTLQAEQFNAQVNAFDLPNTLPGVQHLVYSTRLSKSEYAVKYISPAHGLPAPLRIGMNTEEVPALHDSIDHTLHSKIAILRCDDNTNAQASTLWYSIATNTVTSANTITAHIEPNTFFQSLLQGQYRGLEFTLTPLDVAGKQTPIFSTAYFTDSATINNHGWRDLSLQHTHVLLIGGLPLQLQTHASNALLDEYRSHLPNTGLLVGLGGSVLLAVAVFIINYRSIKNKKIVELINPALLDAIEQSVIITDPSYHIQQVNKAFTAMTGYALDEVKGKSPSFQKGPHTDPQTSARIQQVLHQKKAITAEILNYRKDGSSYWKEISLSPVLDAHGKLIHYIGIGTDVTQRVQTQMRVRQDHQNAEAALQARSQFLANINHEIRSPLNGILGMLQLLERTPLNPLQSHYAQQMHLSGNLMMTMLNSVLDFSKIDAGMLEIAIAPFEISYLVKELNAIVTPQVGDKPIEMVLDVDPTIPPILLGDALRLEQVLTNLCTNAIKFTTRGEVRLQIKPIYQDQQQVTLYFAVRDTGIGIPTHLHSKIFNSFEQADNSNQRKYGGTGLGLTISRQLVALMGGTLSVESTPGQGSVFYFSLTLKVAQHEVLAAAKTSASIPAAHPNNQHAPALQGVRILVAEDNSINQKVVRLLLESEGAEVHLAENGQIAINEVANANPAFDVVLMDLQMPVMDGYAATQAIRQDLGLSNLPIIALTASAMLTDQQECINAGMNDHISKPFNAEQLVAAVLKHLG